MSANLPCLFLAAACAAWGQARTVNLRGRILEKANLSPVPGALVKLAGTGLAALSDSRGGFILTGTTSLSASPGALPAPSRIRGRSPRLRFGREGRDALGIRVTYGLPGPLPAAPARKAGAAARLDVSADLLLAKSVPAPADTGDLGDIVLDYPPRRLDVGSPPIYGALVLFDGAGDSTAARAELEAKWVQWINPWRASKGLGATPVLWKIMPDPEAPTDRSKRTMAPCCLPRDGSPEWGYDDLLTKQRFRDFQLHVEFNMYGGPGDAAPGAYTNSGVYLQNRYEIQIETPPNPWDPKNSHGIASIIQEYPPDKNMIRAPGKWQAYDITFRAARYNGNAQTAKARISIWWNGIQVHKDREAAGPLANPGSGGANIDSTAQGLKLQNEKGLDVRYRNIWIKELNLTAPDTDLGY